MRLLRSQCDDQGYFSLVEFERDKIPGYAILSHTWLEASQEVTYEDIHQHSGQEKEGYGKLRFCADRAKAAGLDYFWVDTCCIKKTDSAELSEAINSMFYWYSRSEICYAFLADVTTFNQFGDPDPPWLAQFRESRWHTRGWTLQELLAPRSVEFWSQYGLKLGDKESLEYEIHHATGLPVMALRGESLHSFPVQERYGWMSGRQTKLDEDQAYCLLGIFDVSIPVIYGEGKIKSISRLNDEIARMFRNNLHNRESTVLSRLGPDHLKPNTYISPEPSQSQTEIQERLFRSLKQDTFDARRLGLTSAQAGTCQWLIDHTIYKSWEDTDKFQEHRGFLWIKGKPGAGKSTMMKFIYDRTEASRETTDIVISFFFNARGADSERSTSGMWRALLYQLLTAAPDLQRVLSTAQFVTRYDTATPPWTVKILSILFQAAVLQLGKRRLICFIDALDECDEEEIRLMVDTLEDIGDTALESGQRLRVCFASRHYPHIRLRYGQEVILELETGHGEDLSSYIKKQLRAHTSKKADEVRLQIEDKANGVFMWAVIVIPILKRELDKGRIHAVRQKLIELPRELSDLFRDMLGRDKDNLAETVLGYQWILFAVRPLTKEEYYYAVLSGSHHSSDALIQWDSQEVTEEDMKQFVSSSSKGLAEVTRSDHTVQFIHESVRDFLLKEEGFRELAHDLGGSIISTSHARLSECCQNYISVDRTTATPINEELSQIGRQEFLRAIFPFIEYATEHILSHANWAAADLDPEYFLRTFPLRLWVGFRNMFEDSRDRRYTNHTSLLYVLAGNGCQNLIQHMCQDRPVIGKHGEYYYYPLLTALAHLHYDAARALLLPRRMQSQTDLKFKTWYENIPDIHPVVWALTQEHDAVAERLLEANDFHWGDVETYEGRSLLCFAVEGNCANVVRRLARMDRFAGLINSQHQFKVPESVTATEKLDRFPTTPLGYAAASGYEKLAGVLIGLGAEINPSVPFQRSPLYCGIRYGTVGVLSSLLRSITDVNRPIAFSTIPRRLWTPLCAAAIYKRLDMVQWLLDQGANVHLGDDNGQNPLHMASERGYEAIVHVLLTHGAEIKASDHENRTALHLAAAHGRVRVVEALLDRSARDTAGHSLSVSPDEDKDKVKILHHHYRTGYTLPTLALTGTAPANRISPSDPPVKEVGIEARDHHGATPLISAARNGREECLRILLHRGAHVNARNRHSETALMHAVGVTEPGWPTQNARRCVDTLLHHGARTEIRDHDGMTALLYAARHRSSLCVARLLQSGADETAADPKGQTARDMFPEFEWEGGS